MNKSYISTSALYGPYIAHHGIKGQKWGIRRFQNEDGTLTEEGIRRYRVYSIGRNLGRAFTNGSVGQRLAVNLNKGYRKDRRQIIGDSAAKAYMVRSSKTKDAKTKRQELKNIKRERKKDLGEARVSTAMATYSWQSEDMNRKIQTQHLGKQIIKSAILGDYGNLNYDRLRGSGHSRLVGIGASFVSGWVNNAVGGGLGAIDYTAMKLGKTAYDVTDEKKRRQTNV